MVYAALEDRFYDQFRGILLVQNKTDLVRHVLAISTILLLNYNCFSNELIAAKAERLKYSILGRWASTINDFFKILAF